MLWIHVGLDLEDESRQLGLIRQDFAGRGLARLRRWRMLDEKIQQQLHAEVVDGRAEEHRRLLARAVGRDIERLRRTLHQFELLAHLAQHVCADARLQCRIVDGAEDGGILPGEIASLLV
jgi:hypothetical protein